MPIKGRFKWDGGPWFEGYYDPEMRWNGWAIPYFTLATAKRIAAVCTELRRTEGTDAYDRVRYQPDDESFIIDNPESHTDNEVVVGRAIEIEGGMLILYAIGGWAWCWWAEGDDN